MCESRAVCKDDEMIAVDDNDVWRESRVHVQICVVSCRWQDARGCDGKI